jgi:hypothetical protein
LLLKGILRWEIQRISAAGNVSILLVVYGNAVGKIVAATTQICGVKQSISRGAQFSHESI